MRTVLFKEDDYREWRNGLFHQWGTIGYGESFITRAIIEDTEGKIYMIEPYHVKFTDKMPFDSEAK